MSANSCIDRLEQLGARMLRQPKHQPILDVTHAVVDAEELQNLCDRHVHAIGQLVEAESPPAKSCLRAKSCLSMNSLKLLPEIAAGGIEHHDRHHLALAGLQQRQHLEPSSSVPKPPGNRQTASHSLTNISLRVKKYFMCTSFGSPAMIALDCLLERQHDVEAHRVLAAGADVARLHDAAGGPGDDEPSRLGHRRGRTRRLAGKPGRAGRVRAEPKTVTFRRER